MKEIKLGGVGPSVSELALGCMRLCNLDTKAAESLLRTAMDQGINFFDHADIYGKGGSESLFASALGGPFPARPDRDSNKVCHP